MRLLLIEDEPAMRAGMIDLLQAHGWRVTTAADGPTGLQRALEYDPDLIVLDVMLPGQDGYSVCAALRAAGRRMPVLMLTAKGQVDDRVTGLECGADDYLVKPFEPRELIARLRALGRRVRGSLEPVSALRLGEAEIDFRRQTCVRTGSPVALTAKEFRVLRFLAEVDGAAVTRDQILDAAWEYNAWPTTRTVDNHLASLRAKLEPDPSRPRFLLTVHRIGYRLEKNPESTEP